MHHWIAVLSPKSRARQKICCESVLSMSPFSLKHVRLGKTRLQHQATRSLALVTCASVLCGGLCAFAQNGTTTATPGKASIQITGLGRYRRMCLISSTPLKCIDIPEAGGTLQITVDGFTTTVNYPVTGPSVIASLIASALTVPNSPVTATTTGGSTVKVTSIAVGANTNYPISFSLGDDDLTCSATTTFALSGGTGTASPSTATSIALAASPNPAGAGAPLQFTAHVTPATATGTVSIYDGTILVGTPHLSGGAAVLSNPGLAVGSHSLTAIYSGDTTYLASTSAAVALTVNKNVPIITWTTPTPIRPGTALSSAQLNATANTPGTFVYTPAVGTILGVGTQTLSVAFTPTDTADYNAASSTTTVVVNGSQLYGPPGTISTIAGNGLQGYTGDGGFATAAQLEGPVIGLGTDAARNVYFCDGYSRVREILASTGTIATVAGNGTGGYSGDGGSATSAQLFCHALAVDAAGDIFIADLVHERIRKVSASTGTITTVAGNGNVGYAGDGGLATNAAIELQNVPTAEYPTQIPFEIGVDAIGDLYFYNADEGGYPGNYDVRVVSASTGIISTFANGMLGRSTLSTNAYFTVDPSGDVYLFANGAIWKATSSSSFYNPLTVVAGIPGEPGDSGDGGQATEAEVSGSIGTTDAAGTLYFGQQVSVGGASYNKIRKIDMTTGIISVAAVRGWSGKGCLQQINSIGDGCLAIEAPGDSYNPQMLAVDSSGDIYTADALYIRGITPLLPTQVHSSISGVSCTGTTYGIGPNCSISISPSAATGTVSLAYSNSSGTAVMYVPADPVISGETIEGISTALPLPVGNYSVAASYSGDGTYAPSIATTSFQVSKATPLLSWPQPVAIPYGTPLNGQQLNASTLVPGIFTYTPGLNTVLSTGSNTLHVSFSPTDGADYTGPVTLSQTVVVTPATPAVSWSTPVPIQYGTPLSASQLNATANVPGAFVYSYAGSTIPSSGGTVLPIGSQTLSVVFTPTSSSNITSNVPVTASVQVEVDPDTPNIASILPNPAAVGTIVTIVGQNFGPSQGSSTVTFNGVAATATSWSDNSIVTTVPAGAATGNVVVNVSAVPSNRFLLMIPKTCP